MEGWKEGGVISIAERKRRQPLGVVTVVTLDVNCCQIDGYVVTIPLAGVVTGSSRVGRRVVTGLDDCITRLKAVVANSRR
jgi:hypothetical protein